LLRVFPILDYEYENNLDSINWAKITKIDNEWGWHFIPNKDVYFHEPDTRALIQYSILEISGYKR